MNIFLYGMIFIIGTFFGSFFTLAVYRIPLKKDITHEHSFCPNCNHKLGFLDLVPIFSYLFLQGKCRYCGEKIKIRYLLLEVLSGFVFLFAYVSLHIVNIAFDFYKITYFIVFVFRYVTLVLIAGIDKEYRKINLSVLLFGVIFESVYILYLYIIENTSIYRYSIYFAIFVLLSIAYLWYVKKKKSTNYCLQILLLITYVFYIVNLKIAFGIGIASVISLLICKMFHKDRKVPVGFVIGLFTILGLIVENQIKFY